MSEKDLTKPHDAIIQPGQLATCGSAIRSQYIIRSNHERSPLNLKSMTRNWFMNASTSSGGVVLASRDGKIVFENSLDARLDVAFRKKLPEKYSIDLILQEFFLKDWKELFEIGFCETSEKI
ncbi:hypothetical protein NC653_030859 [Populus alba x Populus x berolinensis]|uniref:Uncharacterized protein n=1 Tax=Populus alba x Populus x berolinensis TaxID=444605 RepID=A0AAD6LWZ2_9ROSI|nr:hypothetical protein NC653_030859 [Populus alba x Populus x berolinensis]